MDPTEKVDLTRMRILKYILGSQEELIILSYSRQHRRLIIQTKSLNVAHLVLGPKCLSR
jgi:hypothetical protein